MARAIPLGSVREKLSFTTAADRSVLQRRDSLGLTYSSLGELMNELSPETRTQTLTVKAGDVRTTITLIVASNGEFSAPIHLHDDGVFWGDKYAITAVLNQAAPDKTVFGINIKGEVSAGSNRDVNEAGRSSWLLEHWDIALAAKLRVHLSTSWTVPIADILTGIFVIIGAVIFGYGEASGKGKFVPAEPGSFRYEVP